MIKAARMKPTCLFLGIFVFQSFINLHVFTLLFNKCHLYNSVSSGSQSLYQEFFCVFVLFKIRIIKVNIQKCLNQL